MVNLARWERANAWKARAACRGAAGSGIDFFPQPNDAEAIRLAQRVCVTCPVREPCFRQGLENEEDGIWGGTTERERARIRRVEKIAANREREKRRRPR